jgi:PhnB protein
MKVQPYLFFNGNCEEALKFYETALGGKITAMLSHEGTPAEEHVPANWKKKIMHAALTLGDQLILASDSPPDYYKTPAGMSVTLNADNGAEAERLFNALSDGATITMPIAETFWAERFGMLTDKFGTPWMINSPEKGGANCA